MMNPEYEIFLNEWGLDFEKIKHILRYALNYPEALKRAGFEDLLQPEDVDQSQKDWVRLCSQFTGMEREFFKPYWIPIMNNALDVFIDLSDSSYPLFESQFYFVEPYLYFKTFVFYDISEFLTLNESSITKKEIDEQRIESIFAQMEMMTDYKKS